MDAYQDPRENGKDISELGLNYKMPELKKKKHANQELTDAIMEVIEDKDYRKWVMRVARSKRKPNDILDMVKVAKDLPEPYSKAGYIWKRL